MKFAPMFKRFDDLTDSPERIPALRKVILVYLLHSAVNTLDSNSRAQTLREVHESRRCELVKIGCRKKGAGLPDVIDEDLPPSLSDIPTKLFDRLGNIASIEKGLSQIQYTAPGDYPLVVTAEYRGSSSTYDFEGPAAIIPLVSSTGHGDASLKRLHYQEGQYAVGNILAVVQPICPDHLSARFIYEYLSAFKDELLVSRMVGTANVSLTVNKLKEVPIPLVGGPVLSRIDKLMALCDQLEAQQQERQARHAALVQASLTRFTQDPTPANLQLLFHPSYTVSPADLRKTILTLAVQGKLVPQESDSVLKTLQSILSEASVNGVSKGPTADTSAVEVLRISAGTSREDFYVNEADFKHVDLPPNDVEKFRLVPGDLLACRFNGNLHFVGRFSLYRGESGRIQVNPDKLIRFRINTALHSPRYVCFAMNAAPTREAIEAMCATTAGNIGLSAGKLKTVEIPLPPLAEQRRIVAKVDELLALVDELETHLAASQAVAQNLLAALVRELTTTP